MGAGRARHLADVHLGRLVGLLAAILVDAPPLRRGHSKVDQLHHIGATLVRRQQDVLQREVAMPDAELVEPARGGEELPARGWGRVGVLLLVLAS